MTDPAADPRVNELLLAEPTQIGTLAGYLHRAADESARTATGLHAAQHDGVWHGLAADRFRLAIGRMPAQLGAIDAGFRDAGSALFAYATAVDRIQTAFSRVTGELADWIAQLDPARAAADDARAGLRRTLHSPGAGAQAIITAQREVERTEGRYGEIDDAVIRLRHHARTLLDEFDRERAGCRVQITQVRALAPPAPVRWPLSSSRSQISPPT